MAVLNVNSPSALLMKLKAASGATNHDVSLSSGNADLLIASGAFVNVVILALRPTALEIREKTGETFLQLQILLVFSISLGNVPGEHSIIEDHQKNEGDDSGKRNSNKGCHQHVGNEYDSEKSGEIVDAVATLHKSFKFVAHIIKHREKTST